MTTTSSLIPEYYFIGFSTIGNDISRKWVYYDVELVNRDLMNHFQTRVGERVMRPTWGCKIWDYMMEPFTPHMQDLITEEATRICESDSRVNITSITVVATENSVQVNIILLYNGPNVAGTFTVTFNNEQI